MANSSFVATSDFTLQVEGGEVEFKKGDLVCLEIDQQDDPFISYLEQAEDGSIHEFELDINTMEVFEAVLESVSAMSEFDDVISFEEMTIDQALFEHGIGLDTLTCYLAEQNRLVRKKKTVTHRGGKRTVLMPVNRRKQKQSPKQRAALKKAQRSARKPGASRKRLKSVQKTKRAMGESSFLINTNLLLGENVQEATKYAANAVATYFGEHATVSLREGSIVVDLKVQEEAALVEALEQAEVNFSIEGDSNIKTVSLVASEDAPVVESYYAEPAAQEDSEEVESQEKI